MRVPFICQGLGAALAVWLLPHGFPLDDHLFWANTVTPGVLAGAAAAGCLGAHRGRRGPVRAAAALWTGAALGLAIAAPLVFPISGSRVLPLALVGLGWTLLGLLGAGVGRRRALLLALLAAGAALGAQNVHARRGLDPATRPANPPPLAPLPGVPKRDPPPGSAGAIEIGLGATLDHEGWVRLRLPGGEHLQLDPFPRFRSRSPDRCWTILGGRAGHVRLPFSLAESSSTPSARQLRFEGPLPGEARVTRVEGALEVDARRTLSEPIYAHLDHAFAFGVSGPRGAWWLRFGGARVEVRPQDYPVGRPARCVVLRRDGGAEWIEVLEARSAEKGPFRRLDRVRLARGILSIGVEREDGPLLRLELQDWAAQASTQRSPTAGWGLPENAIEFWLAESGASLWVSASWAATSLGRGWDSVGHAAGTYRNRIRIEPAPR